MAAPAFLSERDKASISGPRAMKTPGELDWCWQTISALQSMWKSLDLDFERYQRVWREAEEHRIWERVPPRRPYGSKDAFIQALQVEDEEAAKLRVAATAVGIRPLQTRGGSQRNGKGHDHDRVQYGPRAVGYLTARIARDHPDIWERMKAGEFSSVAAAARAAGIPYKVSKTVALGDPIKVAAALRRHFNADQIKQIIRDLQNG